MKPNKLIGLIRDFSEPKVIVETLYSDVESDAYDVLEEKYVNSYSQLWILTPEEVKKLIKDLTKSLEKKATKEQLSKGGTFGV